MTFLQIKNLFIKRNDIELFDDFSIDIEKNSICGIFAKSGSGKTTLLNWISGLLKEDEDTKIKGDLIFCENKKPQISYVFQEQRLIETVDVYKNISLPLENIFTGVEIKQKIEEILFLLGLEDKKNSLPLSLSGGERQRVSIARSFLFPSELLLLDEPFHFLDSGFSQKVKAMISSFSINKEKTVLLVSHEKNDIDNLCDVCIYENHFKKSIKT